MKLSIPSKTLFKSSENVDAKGFTLVELAIVMIIVSILIGVFFSGLRIYVTNKNAKLMDDRTYEIRRAISEFIKDIPDEAGKPETLVPIDVARFPCPASLTVAQGTTSYGAEVCPASPPSNGVSWTLTELGGAGAELGGPGSGVFVLRGFNDEPVLVGAVPTQRIGVGSESASDIFGNRFLYAVSANHVADDELYVSGIEPPGHIRIVEQAQPVVAADLFPADGKYETFALISMGADGRGAYGSNSGRINVNCSPNTTADGDSRNCAWQSDNLAIFRDRVGDDLVGPDSYDDKIFISLVEAPGSDDGWWREVQPNGASPLHIRNKNDGNVGIGTEQPLGILHAIMPANRGPVFEYFAGDNAGNPLGVLTGAHVAIKTNAGTLASPNSVNLQQDDVLGMLSFGNRVNGTMNAVGNNWPAMIAANAAEDYDAAGANRGAYLRFMTRPSTSDEPAYADPNWPPLERMRITDNGFVGIGIENPWADLHVVGKPGEDIVRSVVMAENANQWPRSSVIATSDARHPVFLGVRGRGSPGAPAAPNAGDVLADFRGWAQGAPEGTDGAGMTVVASETPSNVFGNERMGSHLRFNTIQNGETNRRPRMTITDEGLVGIGITTPQEQLHITGDFVQDLTPDTTPGGKYVGSGFGQWTHLGMMDNSYGSVAGGAAVNPDDNQYGMRINWDSDRILIGLEDNGADRKDGIVGMRTGNINDRLFFEMNGQKVISIEGPPAATGNGNVGINVEDPNGRLHIKGNIRVENEPDWWTPISTFSYNSTFNRSGGFIGHRARGDADNPAGAQAGDIIVVFEGRGEPRVVDPGTPHFGTGMRVLATETHRDLPGREVGAMGSELLFTTVNNGTNSSTVKMKITHDGMVGINNYTPTYQLDVGGQIRAAAWVSPSDARLKTNITGTVGLDSLVKIKGHNYRWNDQASDDMVGRLDTGVIAQELLEIPELAHLVLGTAGDLEKGETLSVNYNGLIPVLIESVKELKADKDKLVVSLEDTNKRLAALESKLSPMRGGFAYHWLMAMVLIAFGGGLLMSRTIKIKS